MTFSTKLRLAAPTLIIAVLVSIPVPLLPPHRLAELLQSLLGRSWPASYLAAAVMLQILFYGSLGLLAALSVNRARSTRTLVLQIILLPFGLVIVSLLIRSAKAHHFPVWINTAVPITACFFGTILGLGLLHRYWRTAVIASILTLAIAFWGFFGGTSSSLRNDTEARLRSIAVAGPTLPTGDLRFGTLLQVAFARTTDDSKLTVLEQNRAAILAWGIAVGSPRLARLVGIDPASPLVARAVAVGESTTLLGRADWPKHYALSAALAIIEHPLISDAGGLMKEQLDTLTRGSGFSFGDLVADRAGVRFAQSATQSESSAQKMQMRLQRSFSVKDFFPPETGFPENLTLEQFRQDYGGVGTQHYRDEIRKIEAELNNCAALTL